MITLSNEMAARIWAQLLTKNKSQLSETLFFLVLKQAGGIRHDSSQSDESAPGADTAHRNYGDPICNRASAKRVDAFVEDLFLTVVNAGTLELTLSYDAKLRQEAEHVDLGWKQKLQRLEYEANLARRRYEAVDPVVSLSFRKNRAN
jgi:hypothetical protein